MAVETLSALLPIIPQILEAGKSAYDIVIRPVLKGLGYGITKSQEIEFYKLENDKNINEICNKLKQIENEITRQTIFQIYNGNNGSQIGINNGTIFNNVTSPLLLENQVPDINSDGVPALARKLLKDLSKTNPPRFQSVQCVGMYMGPYGNMDDPREIADMEYAIEILENMNLIKALSLKREIFEITATGYKEAEKIIGDEQ
jgi:hypothetical protein